MTQRRRRQKKEILISDEDRLQTVVIEQIVAGGYGLTRRSDGKRLLVAGAAVGEKCIVSLEHEYKDYATGIVVEVLTKSTERIDPKCEIFGECGGCQLQHISYKNQILAKEEIVRDTFSRIGEFENPNIYPMVAAVNPWAYRNHVRFSTGKLYGDAGFVPRTRRGLVKVNECPVAVPWINDQIPDLQGKVANLHQVQLRHSDATNESLINPKIEQIQTASGQSFYHEELAGFHFRISQSSFFQVNSMQAENLVRLVSDALPNEAELLVDAYAGVGTFAVIFSSRFRLVVAIEESHGAVKDAEFNVREFPNIGIQKGKVENVLPNLGERADALILDPPRVGCAPAVLDSIILNAPNCLVYVSCDPATLARDLAKLMQNGFRLDYVTPIDMFPQTAHIECVAKLTFSGTRTKDSEYLSRITS
jgi:23S rRNA (uracil1939-C5)-methyltransferase